MSAGAVLQAAAVAALREVTGLTGVFDAPPVRSAMPHAVVEEPVTIDWSAKDWTGREARLVVRVVDGAERPVRLRALMAAVEDAVPGLSELGDGWRLVALRFVRGRISGTGERWTGVSEFSVRMWREGEGGG